MRALTVQPRFSVFTIIDSLVARHRDGALFNVTILLSKTHTFVGLKTLGKDFMTGYIGLAEGEKDPRNLLLAFAIDRVILIEFDVESQIEVHFALVP